MSSSDGNDIAVVSAGRAAGATPRVNTPARAAETAALAGRFAGMLESLNGVDARSNDNVDAPIEATGGSHQFDRPVSLGAVSLLAMNQANDEGATAPQSTVATTDARSDARWLAMLQGDVAAD